MGILELLKQFKIPKMKHAYLLLMLTIALLTGQIGFAQTLLSENFENGIPNNWYTINVDNRTVDSNVSWVTGAWIPYYDVLDTTNHVAESTSWFNPVGTADRWLISPLVTLTTNNYLQWRGHAVDPNNPDGYEVRISTASGLPSTTQFTANPALLTLPHENGTWTTRRASLSAYAGQTVRIAFRNNSNNEYLLDIDDITIATQPTYDVTLNSSARPEYSRIPKRFVQPISFGATAYNLGVDTCVAVKVKATVINTSNATIVFKDSSAPVAKMAPAAVLFLSTPSTFTPSDTGVYVIQYVVSTASNDTTHSNDTLLQAFAITDSVYSRDLGPVSGSYGAGDSIAGYFGEMFEVTDTAAITSVSFLLVQPVLGDTTSAAVFRLGATAPDSLIATTPLYIIDSATQQFITLPIAGGSKVLWPGKYVVVAKEYFHSLSVAATNDVFTSGTVWVKFPLDTTPWHNVEFYNARVTFIVRPNFGICSITPDSVVTKLPTCAGINNGSAKLVFTSGYGALTYNWNNGNTTDSIDNLGTLTPYKVTVTDGFGCKYQDSVYFVNPQPIVDSIYAERVIHTYSFARVLSGGVPPFQYLWYINNFGLDTISHSDTAVTCNLGTYYLIVTDSNGCVKKDSISFANICEGINEINTAIKLAAYPNPTNSQLNVSILLPNANDITLRLYNVTGQKVYEQSTKTLNQLQTTIDMNSLPSGVYVIHVKTAIGVQVMKVVRE